MGGFCRHRIHQGRCIKLRKFWTLDRLSSRILNWSTRSLPRKPPRQDSHTSSISSVFSEPRIALSAPVDPVRESSREGTDWSIELQDESSRISPQTPRFRNVVPERNPSIQSPEICADNEPSNGSPSSSRSSTHNVIQDGRPKKPWTEAQSRQKRELDVLDIASLIMNKMIGTGIFTTPGTVLMLTKSKRLSLGLWAVGGVYSMVW